MRYLVGLATSVIEGLELKISVYIATSLDGFIARSNGNLDWLAGSSSDVAETPVSNTSDSSSSGAPEDYGFWEFFNSIDTMVTGRGTFEFVASTGQWVYEGKRVIVLSSTMSSHDVPSNLVGKVEILSMEPADLAEKLADEGAEHVYVDGGITIQRFLHAGLIDELTLTRAPVLLGTGIPLFGELDADVHLRHVETKSFESGFLQSTYVVER